MDRKIKSLVFISVWVIIIFIIRGTTDTLLAQDDELEASDPLQVYTTQSEPFVFVKPERLSGFSIDLWKEIAFRANLEYEWVVVDRFTDILEGVTSGEADVGISAISMTAEREKVMDFTHPYFISGLRVMTLKQEIRPLRNTLSIIFSLDVLKLFGVFFILIVISAHIIWLLERRTNEHFPHGYLEGLWEAIWWAAVTVTTVGYGDRVPLGKAGRVLGLFWMVAGLFLVANLTAGVTSQMTVRELQDQHRRLADMANSTVATKRGTTAEDFLIGRGINYIIADDLEEAHQMLLDDRAEGVLLDAPLLTYYAQKNGNGQLEVIGEAFEEEFYGIALPLGSPHREQINQILLEIIDDGTFNEIYMKWFGEDVEW